MRPKDDHAPSVVWRLGRMAYLCLLLIPPTLNLAIRDIFSDRDWTGALDYPSAPYYFLALGTSVFYGCLIARARLRDMGESPDQWWHLLIPVYNLFFLLRLILTGGKRERGERGDNGLYWVLAGVLGVLTLSLTARASLLPTERGKQPSARAQSEENYPSPTQAPVVPVPHKQCQTAYDCQKVLSDFGYPITVDGVWGPKSQETWDWCVSNGRCGRMSSVPSASPSIPTPPVKQPPTSIPTPPVKQLTPSGFEQPPLYSGQYKEVYVRPYVRKDGTHVRGHFRSK